jgi:hypothetical protein
VKKQCMTLLVIKKKIKGIRLRVCKVHTCATLVILQSHGCIDSNETLRLIACKYEELT